jgi:hypothetical protein
VRRCDPAEVWVKMQGSFTVTQILETLNTSVTKCLNIDREEYNQTNKENIMVCSQKIENFYQENKEAHEKLFVSQQETITTQQFGLIPY